MAKIGERFVEEMIDRGRREAAAPFFTESNVAQPMYPLRGGYEVSKGAAGLDEPGPSLAERLKEPEQGPDDPGRDDPDHGLEWE